MENIDITLTKFIEEHSQTITMFETQRKNLRRLWNISENTAHFLFKQVLQKRPRNILEIGTSNGYSTFWLAGAMNVLNLHENSYTHIDTIDVDPDRQFLAKDNLKTFENIKFHLGKAHLVLKQFDHMLDFVFIDANKSQYLRYMQEMLPFLNKDCWIFADNTVSHDKSVNEYLDYVRKSDLFDSRNIEMGTGIEFSIYKG